MGGPDTVADVAGWAREDDLAATTILARTEPGPPPPDVNPNTPLIRHVGADVPLRARDYLAWKMEFQAVMSSG